MAISPWKIQPNTKDLSTPWIQPVDEYVASQIEEQKLYQRQRPVDEMQNKFKNGEVGFQQATDWFTGYQPKAVYQKEQQNLRQAQSDVTSSWRTDQTNIIQGQYKTGQIDYNNYDTKMHEVLSWYPEDSAKYGEDVNMFADAYNQELDNLWKEMELIGGDQFAQFAQWFANKKKEGFNVNTENPQFTYDPAKAPVAPTPEPAGTTPAPQEAAPVPTVSKPTWQQAVAEKQAAIKKLESKKNLTPQQKEKLALLKWEIDALKRNNAKKTSTAQKTGTAQGKQARKAIK
ncbi:hypothetical protein M0R04_12190 [Candidatus Dojkabacteria bacterium]|jgi:hypothetical protein|nr:hypothetical protein [Candidatus Dojkabacteria bacterium]